MALIVAQPPPCMANKGNIGTKNKYRQSIKNINAYKRLSVTFLMRNVTTIKRYQQLPKESHLNVQTVTVLRTQNVTSHVSEQTSI